MSQNKWFGIDLNYLGVLVQEKKYEGINFKACCSWGISIYFDTWCPWLGVVILQTGFIIHPDAMHSKPYNTSIELDSRDANEVLGGQSLNIESTLLRASIHLQYRTKAKKWKSKWNKVLLITKRENNVRNVTIAQQVIIQVQSIGNSFWLGSFR